MSEWQRAIGLDEWQEETKRECARLRALIAELMAALQRIVDEADSDDGMTAWDGGDIARAALANAKDAEVSVETVYLTREAVEWMLTTAAENIRLKDTHKELVVALEHVELMWGSLELSPYEGELLLEVRAALVKGKGEA